VTVECGQCGGPVYMLPCPDHEYAIASECQGECALIVPIECPECRERGSRDG
jgi:hypothetical protein